jgi:hypothetical protein
VRVAQHSRMTEVVSRDVGVALFILFSAYGLIGTLRVAPLNPGPRPWALFAVLETIEAVQVYALVAGPSPRPEADVRAAALVSLAALCFCAYLQRLFFVMARTGNRSFPRGRFYTALAVFIAVLFAAHFAAPILP